MEFLLRPIWYRALEIYAYDFNSEQVSSMNIFDERFDNNPKQFESMILKARRSMV